MVAKMILPLLGGTPGVWNTCMVFFQAALLCGYLYSHLLTTWFNRKAQTIIHAALLLLPFLVLPIAVSSKEVEALSFTANPIPWALSVLAVSVGLPFFVVSTTGPLLQKWFAETGHSAAKDPYFLYG